MHCCGRATTREDRGPGDPAKGLARAHPDRSASLWERSAVGLVQSDNCRIQLVLFSGCASSKAICPAAWMASMARAALSISAN